MIGEPVIQMNHRPPIIRSCAEKSGAKWSETRFLLSSGQFVKMVRITPRFRFDPLHPIYIKTVSSVALSDYTAIDVADRLLAVRGLKTARSAQYRRPFSPLFTMTGIVIGTGPVVYPEPTIAIGSVLPLPTNSAPPGRDRSFSYTEKGAVPFFLPPPAIAIFLSISAQRSTRELGYTLEIPYSFYPPRTANDPLSDLAVSPFARGSSIYNSLIVLPDCFFL